MINRQQTAGTKCWYQLVGACVIWMQCTSWGLAQTSVARKWDEAILDAIRIDTPRPPVHARNLYHLSAAMYDAWATYDTTARGSFVLEKNSASDIDAARNEAISYAAYRVLSDRYQLSVQAAQSQLLFDGLMDSLGYDKHNTSTLGNSPAAIGNRIAQQILNASLADGANEANNYADDSGHVPQNPPMIAGFPTVTDQVGTPLQDPNRWQPLYINQLTAQNGIVLPSNLQQYIGAGWADVTSFAMRSENGPYSWSRLDPGPPPQLNGPGDAYRQQAMQVLRMSNGLDPQQGTGAQFINISPSINGNRPLGTHTNQGYPVNPVTGQVYGDQFVKEADYARVLAEFWADGPDSETPPGHWNVIANAVSDNPLLTKQIGGEGPVVNNLEWDVKMYLALNGAVHDAAIGAWGVKRLYDGVRPITMIRYMGSQGQSSDPQLPSYSVNGLPLEAGLVELITAESIAVGGRHRNAFVNANRDHLGAPFAFFDEADLVGKIAVHAWGQQPNNPATEIGGTDWILAENWLPYQADNFVTPAFPGYTSGHSTFSRSAAEVLAGFTGSPYFPGGLGQFTLDTDYLRFEDGPSTPVTLQWASYFDAADEAGISRLWGGIHVAEDDFAGRRMGSEIGKGALRLAGNLFEGALDTDLNHDGSIDAADAGILFGNWGQSGDGDINLDGIVDAADAGLVFGDWTGDLAPISPAAVPEPSGLGLVTTGLLIAAYTRGRRR